MAAELPGYSRLENSRRPPLHGARAAGPADPHERVVLCLVLRRRRDAPELPGHAYWASTPPGRRTFLTRAEFAARYGAAPDDLAAVANFCRASGFTVIETHAGRRCVVASTSVAVAGRVFAVDLNSYATPRETYRGYEGEVRLPPEIAGVVVAVLGLDNRRLGVHASNGALQNPVTPLQVANFYQFPPNAQWPKNASGQTIGILEFGGGYNVADFKAYFKSLNIAAPAEVISVPASMPQQGSSNFPDSSDIEVALDVEVAGAVAQGAKIVIYFGQGFLQGGNPDEQGWYSLVSTAIHDATNKPTVLSVSWSDAEDRWGNAPPTISSLFAEDAPSMGVTVFASSGDYGASGYVEGDGDGQRHVHYPASDPYVTGCGGTAIQQVQPWFEMTWNDQSGATGGGVSSLFPVPSWQNGVQADMQPLSGRGVPDIAGNASALSAGYDIYIYGMKLSDLGGSTPPTVAGTSAAAPLYAGLMALINANIFPSASAVTSATSVGFLNPTLYGVPADVQAKVFNDVNDGGNNSYDGAQGYTTTQGWDPCTGWGSLNGGELANYILINYAAQNPGCVAAVQAFIQVVARAIGSG